MSLCFFFFFFKQKTAYEMRISDWSSDVCSTSDTEVIIHLVATSNYRSLLDRFIDALKQVEGAYSLICLTAEGMIGCRDPLGIRPLVIGKLGDAHLQIGRAACRESVCQYG